MEDLAGERFNGPPAESATGYRDLLNRLGEEAGFTPDIAYVVRDVTVGRAFVAAGVSVALMLEPAIPAMTRALADAATARLGPGR
jgi:LysR substrate binding domain